MQSVDTERLCFLSSPSMHFVSFSYMSCSLCLHQATLSLQVSYIPPPGLAPVFQPPHQPESVPHNNPTVELDTVTSNVLSHLLHTMCIISLIYIYFPSGSDFSGHSGRGGHGEHDDAGAYGGPGSRRRALHGHRRPSGARGPRVAHRPDAQTLAAVLQHPRRAEEEEERSEQSAQTAAQQTSGPSGAECCRDELALQSEDMLTVTPCGDFGELHKKHKRIYSITVTKPQEATI